MLFIVCSKIDQDILALEAEAKLEKEEKEKSKYRNDENF